MIELIFISGPLLTAAIAAVASPGGRADRLRGRGGHRHGDLHRAAADAPRRAARTHAARAACSARSPRPACARSCSISLPTGIGIGMLEVGIPAFSRAEGAAAAAGVLLALWSFGSGIGGLLYGTLPRRARPVPDAPARRRAAAADAAPARRRAVGVGDGAARDPGGLLHRAAARDPQRAGRRRRAAGDAHRGLHVADHVVRRRDRDRRRAVRACSSRARAGGRRSSSRPASPPAARCWPCCGAGPSRPWHPV